MKGDRELVLRLLRTASGQINGIIKMVEEDRYCIDISNQLLATDSIIKKANREVLRGHLDHCVKEAFAEGNGDEKVQEILDLLTKMTS